MCALKLTSSTQDTKAVERNVCPPLLSEKPKPFSYLQCDKRFATAEYLTDHLRMHVTSSNQDVKTKGTSAANPMQVNLQPKPFKCSQCDESYDTAEYWQQTQHERMHTVEKGLKCCYCDFKTYWRRNLSTHQKACRIRYDVKTKGTTAGNPLQTNKPKPFKCSQCDKNYDTAEYLKQHEGLHTSGKPFKCVYCDYRTNWRGNLGAHQKELMRLEPVHPVRVSNISSLMNNEVSSRMKEKLDNSANIQQKNNFPVSTCAQCAAWAAHNY